MREIKLPSGATLKVNAAPFADAKQLFQTLCAESRSIAVVEENNVINAVKDFLCTGAASPSVEAALAKCFSRCTVNGLRVDGDTFEPVERRGDYIPAAVEVIVENVLPFAKGLYAVYKDLTARIAEKIPA